MSELEATAALAERLRADVYHLLKGGVELSIMLALGQSNNYESLEALLKGVERQLSEAKKSEGNCVISE